MDTVHLWDGLVFDHDQLLIVGLTPLGERFVSLLFAHRRRNGDLRRLAVQSKSC